MPTTMVKYIRLVHWNYIPKCGCVWCVYLCAVFIPSIGTCGGYLPWLLVGLFSWWGQQVAEKPDKCSLEHAWFYPMQMIISKLNEQISRYYVLIVRTSKPDHHLRLDREVRIISPDLSSSPRFRSISAAPRVSKINPVTVVGWTPRFELIHTAFFIIHYLLNCYAKNMETTYVKRPRRANQQPPKEVHSPQLRLPLRCVCPCYGLMTQLFATSWSFKSQCVLASHLIIGSLNPNFGSLLQIRPGHPAAAFPWRFWRNSMASSSPIQPQGCPIHEGPPELSWLTCVGYIGLW
jgi:hypothetical protein